MSIELCEHCGDPTEKAGVGEDSIVCDFCGCVICEDCLEIDGNENGKLVCYKCDIGCD